VGLLYYAIIMHEYPFSIAQHKYLVKFIKSLRPSFPLKPCATVRKEIMNILRKRICCMHNSKSCPVVLVLLWIHGHLFKTSHTFVSLLIGLMIIGTCKRDYQFYACRKNIVG
jgi:hypothetical protein